MNSGGSDSGSPPLEASGLHTYVNAETGHGFTVISPSPIGNIPLDLFVAIIHLILDVNSSTRSRNDLQNLRLVSKRWSQVVKSFPFFWATVHSTAPPNWIIASVERSKSLPLTVRCTFPYRAADFQISTSYTNLTTLLVPQSQRWKKLSVVLQGGRYGSVRNPLSFLRTYDAPNLESLTLSGRGTDATPWNDFGGHTPRLRRVYLSKYTIPWTSAILHSGTLQYLYLLKLMFKMPTSSELCNILVNSPRLRIVEVSGRVARSPVDTDTAALPPMALPELTRLCLDVEPQTLLRVLSRLHIPACSRLKVGMGKSTLSVQSNMLASLLQHLASRLRALAGNLVVKAPYHGKYYVSGRSGRMDLDSIRVPSSLTSLLNVYEAQKSSLEAHPIPTTTLVLGASGPHLLAMFCENGQVVSKSINRIVISGPVVTAQANLQCLRDKLAEDTSSPTEWPCPNLAEVELAYHCHLNEDIIAFVEARCVGAGVRLNLSSTVNRPDEKMEEFIRMQELVTFEWKGSSAVPSTDEGLEGNGHSAG